MKSVYMFLRLPTNSNIIMAVCILARRSKMRYFLVEIGITYLVGYYNQALFAREIRVLSIAGYSATPFEDGISDVRQKRRQLKTVFWRRLKAMKWLAGSASELGKTRSFLLEEEGIEWRKKLQKKQKKKPSL
jgi:hypothetical protein